MKQPNIDFLMNMTKEYLDGKIDAMTYSLDFPYELEQRYQKAHREEDDYCELIYECLLSFIGESYRLHHALSKKFSPD